MPYVRLSLIAMLGILSSFLCICKSEAQFRIAAEGSFAYGSFTSFDRTPGRINNSNINLNTSSTNRTYGFGLELAWRELILNSLGLSSDFEYQISRGELSSDIFAVGSTLQHYQIDGRYTAYRLGLGPMLSAGPLEISLTPWIEFRNGGGTFTEQVLIDSPLTAQGASSTIAAGDSIASAHTQTGLKLDVGWPLFIGSIQVIPRAFASLNLTQLGGPFGKAMSGGISLSVPLYDDTPPPTPPQREGRKVRDSARAAANIHPRDERNGAVRFLSGGHVPTSGLPLERSRSRNKQYTLLTTSFDSLFLVRMHRLTKSEAATFSYDHLSNTSAEDLHRETLNIFGFRLATAPATRYSLRGPSSASGFMQMLATYLDSTWGISRTRLDIVSNERLPSVAFESTDKNITAPLVTQWVQQSFSVPSIKLLAVQDSQYRSLLHLSVDGAPTQVLWQDTNAGNSAARHAMDTIIDLESNTIWQSMLSAMPADRHHDVVAKLTETNGKDTLITSDTLHLLTDPKQATDAEYLKRTIFLFPVAHAPSTSATEEEARKLLYAKVRELGVGIPNRRILIPEAKASEVLGELNEALEVTNPVYEYAPSPADYWEVIFEE